MECQVHCHILDNVIDNISNNESAAIFATIWTGTNLNQETSTTPNRLDEIWSQYIDIATDTKKELEDQAASYLLLCKSKIIPVGETSYNIQFADDDNLQSIHTALKIAATVIDHQVKIHHLSQLIENDGKFILFAYNNNVAMANMSFGGYIIIAKLLAGSNFPLNNNQDIATCLGAKKDWFEKDLLLKMKRVIGWLISYKDKSLEELGSNQQLAFAIDDLRKCNRTKELPNYNIFSPEDEGFLLTSSNHLPQCKASIALLSQAIQSSFKICIDGNNIGIMDGPGLTDPDLCSQFAHSITESALTSFNTAHGSFPALKQNHDLHLERLINPFTVMVEYSHILFSGIPPFLIEDESKLVLELTSIGLLHPELNLPGEHISAGIAKDRNWNISLGNRHGVLLALPLPHCTMEPTLIGMVTTSFSKQHRYLASQKPKTFTLDRSLS